MQRRGLGRWLGKCLPCEHKHRSSAPRIHVKSWAWQVLVNPALGRRNQMDPSGLLAVNLV